MEIKLQPTNVRQFLQDLDSGKLEKKLAHVLSQVANAVVGNSKPGSVTIDFKLKQMGDSRRVEIAHTLKYSQPTHRGKVAEDNTTSTVMYVSTIGEITYLDKEEQGELDLRPGLRGVEGGKSA